MLSISESFKRDQRQDFGVDVNCDLTYLLGEDVVDGVSLVI